MNRIYRLVWNRALRVVQVASEFAHPHGGGATGGDETPLRKRPLALACALVLGMALVSAPRPAAAQTEGVAGGNGSGGSGGAGSSGSNAGGNGSNLQGNGSAGGGTNGSGGAGGVYSYGPANGGTSSGGGSGGGSYDLGAPGGGGGAGGGLSSAGYGGGGGGGANGNNGTGGGGGGGGGLGTTFSGTITTLTGGTYTGGDGGNGANGNGNQGSGGGGAGGGGAGALLSSSGNLNNGAKITGGDGGSGGTGAGGGGGGSGGGGGGGGAGLLMDTSSTLRNSGSISGGNGGSGDNYSGAGGVGVYAASGVAIVNTGSIGGGIGGGANGQGGVGVVITGNSSLTTSGSISGGAGDSGNGTPADAVDLSGGGNTLTLENGYSFTGNVVSTSDIGASATNGGDTLALGGNTNGTFNLAQVVNTPAQTWAGATLYYGFANLAKSGSSTWVVTGSTTSAAPWTISGGTLQVGSGSGGGDGALTGNVTDNAVLVFDNTAASTYAGVVSGTGTLTQQGSDTLTLTGANTYSGVTTISAGTLTLSGNGSIAGSADVIDNGTFDISNTAGGASIVSLDGNSTSTVNLGSQTLTLTNASGTFAGAIEGSGGLSVSGGTETLSGFNSYTGATTINNDATLIDLTSVGALTSTTAFNLDSGTLELNNVNLTTSAAVTLGSDGGTFSILGTTGGQRRSLELDGSVTGTGGLNFIADGSDSLILTNADNTYSGGTTLMRASPFAPGALPALVVEATGALGSGGVTVGVGTSLAFYGTSSNTVDAGARTIQLDGDNNLYFNDATAGQATITMASQTIGGTLVYFNAGSDAGTSSITVGGADNLTFNQDSSAASASIDNAGQTNEFAFTNFGSGSTAGNATIDNSNWGITLFTDASAGSANITNGNTSATTLQDSDAGTATFTNVGSSSLPSAADANSDNYYVGGVLEIFGNTDASQATVVNNSGGAVYVSGSQGDPLADPSIGSLSGAGTLLLGSNYDANGNAIPFNLALGALGNDDTISGVIRDDTQQLGVSFGDGITKVGSGTLTLDGINTYTGLTEVQAGTLVIGDSSSPTASIAGNAQVDSGATLRGHGTIGGNVEVLSGGIVEPGDSIGTLTVNGNFTAAQGSLMDFAFGAPGTNFQTAGTGDSVAVGGNLEFDGATLNVTNAGGMGPGLYNVFTYGGTLTESNGGLSLGTTPADQTLLLQNLTGQKQINLIDTTGYTLDVWNANGQASATQMGGGSGTWSATSPMWTDPTGATPNGPMSPQPGFAIFGGTPGTVTVDDSAGSVQATGLQFAVNGYMLNGGTLTLVANNGTAPIVRVGDGSSAGADMTATIDDAIAGSAGLTKTDLGTLVLAGSNIYTGGTIIDGGTLSVSSDANLGDASGGLTLDGGTLEVTGTAFNSTTRAITLGSAGGGFDIDDAGNDFTVSQALSGSGTLSKDGAGTLTLTGANSYTGGTTINAGTLVASSASLPGAVTDNAALIFDQTSDGTFSGAISGNGSFAKDGAGTLILDGNSSGFAGSTSVQAGTLEVGDASTPSAVLGGNVTVDSGGVLRGHGTIGGSVTNSGTVWAGGSIGTLTIQGDYTQNVGSTLTLDALSTGQASVLAVDGKATILGGSAVVLAATGNWAPQTDYTILTATGGVSGQFASASSSLLFLNPILSYTANAVNLSLQRNDVSFASVAQTPNQKAVAAVADGLGFGSPVYSALTTLDAPTARHAFDQLSGVLYASTRTALLDDSRYVRDAINRHLLGLNNDGAEGATADGVSAWTSAWGHGGHENDDGNAAALQANGSGLLVGADLPLGTDARLGAVLGHGQNSIQSNSVGSSEHVLGDHAGLYGSGTFGGFVLRAGAVYSWQDVHSNRAVAFGNYSDWLTSEHHAQTAQAYVEGGYRFEVSPGQQLEPFVNVARVRVHDDALQEGGGDAALAVAGNSSSVNTAILGLRDTLTLDAAGGIHAHASLGWQQAWGDLTPVSTMRFVDGGDSFAIAGLPVARHALTTDLGIDFKVAKNVTVGASYLGQFASGVQDQGARMSLTVTF